MRCGHLDGVSDGRIQGWAWDPADPSERAEVSLWLDGVALPTVVADRARPDLMEAGHTDGRCAFDVLLPPGVDDGRRHVIEACHPDGLPLGGSPWRGWIGAASVTDAAPSFRSAYGGLWTDLSNAPDVIDGKLVLGRITAAEAALLHSWVHDGYVILRGAVPAPAIDALNAELERALSRGDPRVHVEAFYERGTRIEPLQPMHRSGRAKLLDVHAHFSGARDVAFAPAVAHAIELFFERPLLAFQSLAFERGVDQPPHRDSAYVRVASPTEFVAAWVALEPVRPGSGELEFYAGSHALPEVLFEGEKWMPEEGIAPGAWGERLRRECEGLRHETFLAEPGDVLLWAADLMHGGSPVRDAALTRRSLVVHYCPQDIEPLYRGASAPRFEHTSGRASYTYCLR